MGTSGVNLTCMFDDKYRIYLINRLPWNKRPPQISAHPESPKVNWPYHGVRRHFEK